MFSREATFIGPAWLTYMLQPNICIMFTITNIMYVHSWILTITEISLQLVLYATVENRSVSIKKINTKLLLIIVYTHSCREKLNSIVPNFCDVFSY